MFGTHFKENLWPVLLSVAQAVIIICILIFGGMGAGDAFLTLFLNGLLLFSLHLLWRFGKKKYCFLPLLLLLAVSSYVGLSLLSLGRFTWFSRIAPLHLFGLLWVAVLLFFLFAVTGSLRASLISGGLVMLALAVTNYVLMQFRGRIFLLSDLSAITAAINVADSYQLDITFNFVLGVLYLLSSGFLTVILAGKSRVYQKKSFCRVIRGVTAFAVILYSALFFTDGVAETFGLRVQWNNNFYEESPVLYFVQNLEQLGIKEPEGYSMDALDDIAKGVENSSGGEEEKKPNIIVIMSESFSDLRALGSLETNMPIAPYFDSLKEESIHGYVYSSVFGGTTANSEFEFLTGNTVAFLSEGTVPYQINIKYQKDTIVSVLKKQGYQAVAMHPYYASGWNREEVYSLFQFDKMMFIGDFLMKKYVRSFISDACDYENLIRVYEEHEKGDPLFLFNITMQNHGSYKYQDLTATVKVSGHEGAFPYAEQYMTLINKTDTATEALISYFRRADEPVILLFFGDHQPSLEQGFYEYVFQKSVEEFTDEDLSKKYLTPFYIWANYDIGTGDMGSTSINYLSEILLNAAGLQTSDFGAFLSELYKEFPVISSHCIMSTAGGHYVLSDELLEASGSLLAYQMFQYNYLYDEGNYMKDFFGLR